MFNAALRQELEIQERFKVCEESINGSAIDIENNKTLPCGDNKIQKFIQESEKLYNQLDCIQESTDSKRNIYNPIINDLKELDSLY